MKRSKLHFLLITIFVAAPSPAVSNIDDSLIYPDGDLFVSPQGKDSNTGNEQSPLTLQKALDLASPGKVIYLKGGIYSLPESVIIQTSGSSDALIRLFACKGETPVLNFSAMDELPSNRGIILDANYWYIRGLVIEEAGDNGMLLSGSYNKIERCIFRKNRDSGLQLSRFNTKHTDISQWPSYNQIIKCESHDNSDSDHEDADGFAPKLTCGQGNVFLGCIAHHNSDDGWDLYSKSETGPIGVVTLIECIAHNNGTLSDGSTSGGGDKNGFKLGSSATKTNHILHRCIAFKNGKHGFTDNGNTASIKFINCTAWDNAEYNWHVRDGATHVFKNNVSLGGGHTDRIVGDISAPNALTEDDYKWKFTASAADFYTLIPGPDSDPLSNGFLKPLRTSSLVNAGIECEGITYSGTAPDLGAVEYEEDIVPVKSNTIHPQKLNWSIKNNSHSISISCPSIKAAPIQLQIISCDGRVVRNTNHSLTPGVQQITIGKHGISKGIYMLKINIGNNMSLSKKITI